MRDVFTPILDCVQSSEKRAECKRKVAFAQRTLDSICVRPFPSVGQIFFTSALFS